jgi:hypothetical protein
MKKIKNSLLLIVLLLNNIIYTQNPVIDQFPYLCEFEKYSDCKLFNVGNDDLEWLFSFEEDRYIFIYRDSIDELEKQAWLECIVDLRNVETAKMSFDYVLASANNLLPGTLQVDINYKEKWKYGIWHTHLNDIEWKKQEIDLSRYCGRLIIISFTGYIEVPESHICLDNVLITGK